MSTSMTLDEVRALKAQIESEIHRQCMTFKAATGLDVSDVRLTTSTAIGRKGTVLEAVEVTVQIGG